MHLNVIIQKHLINIYVSGNNMKYGDMVVDIDPERYFLQKCFLNLDLNDGNLWFMERERKEKLQISQVRILTVSSSVSNNINNVTSLM